MTNFMNSGHKLLQFFHLLGIFPSESFSGTNTSWKVYPWGFAVTSLQIAWD